MNTPKCLGLICREPKYCADMGECCRLVGQEDSGATAAPVMSITDELVDELAYEFGAMSNPDNYNDQAVRVSRTVLAIIAERAQLKRDAERYWWLNDSPHSFGILRAMSTGDLTGPMVDDAIDAYMQAAQ